MERLLLIAAGLFATAEVSVAQSWTQTGAGTNNWGCIASSADGSRLIDGVYSGSGQFAGLVYLSTNSGTTWTPTITTTDDWVSLASSADGTTLMAISCYSGIYTSTNSGMSWVSTNLPDSPLWAASASSADGKTLAVACIPQGSLDLGFVYCSTNSGATWTSNHLGDTTGLAMSADGTKIFALVPPTLWRSTNSGTTWRQASEAPNTYASLFPSRYIASSADGKKLIYCVPSDVFNNPGQVYVSTNSGDSWTLTSVPSNNWVAVTSSADGNTLLAVPQPGPIWFSTNSGASWSTNNSPSMPWTGVASSADGGKLFAAAFGDTVYISQSVHAPCINIAPTHGSVKLAWFVPSTNFALQESSDLSGWSTVTNTPVFNLNNLQNEVFLSPTNSMDFYRLSSRNT